MDLADDMSRFESLMAHSEVQVPEDLRSGSFFVFRELQDMAGIVRRPRPAESEPAAVFNILAITSMETKEQE